MKEFLIGRNALVNGNPETLEPQRNAIIDLGASTDQLLWFVPYQGSLHGYEPIHLEYYDSFFALEAPKLNVTAAWHESGMKRLQRRQRELALLLKPYGLALEKLSRV